MTGYKAHTHTHTRERGTEYRNERIYWSSSKATSLPFEEEHISCFEIQVYKLDFKQKIKQSLTNMSSRVKGICITGSLFF